MKSGRHAPPANELFYNEFRLVEIKKERERERERKRKKNKKQKKLARFRRNPARYS
jgi:hypothetical protein